MRKFFDSPNKMGNNVRTDLDDLNIGADAVGDRPAQRAA